MEFKDLFSKQAKEYAKYRPRYTPELFKTLSGLADEHKLAWDCATGNGQAAMGLAPYFDEIIATDASASQIEHAEPHPKITYRVAPAENSGLEDSSCDIVTVATAIHWLNEELFYPEVKRILKPRGVIAVWTYGDSTVNPDVDKVIGKLSRDILGKYWAPEIQKAWDFDGLIGFPFERIDLPRQQLVTEWTLEEYTNYMYTWSATHNYINLTGKNPLDIISEELTKTWGGNDVKRKITWPIGIKAGRV